MKTILFSLLLTAFAVLPAQATDVAVTDTTFLVSGNCGMCKSRIEKTTTIKGVKLAKWNKSTKMLRVAFVNGTVTVDSLQRRLAAVGHDTGTYRAPDAVYQALPECCLYRDNPHTH